MEPLLLLSAIVPSVLYAGCNVIDKVILAKYIEKDGVEVLLIVSAILSGLALPALLVADILYNGNDWWHIFDVSLTNLGILVVVAFMNVALLWCYLKAMDNDEPTVVILYYNLVPVIALGLGYVLLGEIIDLIEGAGMTLVIIGAVVMSVVSDADGRVRFRMKTAGYMLTASTLWASETTLFKVVALEESVIRSFFWEHVVLLVVGITLAMKRRYRHAFLAAWHGRPSHIVGLNVTNEGLYMLGNFIAGLVVVKALASLALLMNSLQSAWVFLIGIALTRLFPHLSVEESWRNGWLKLLAIALSATGVMLIGEWE